MGPAIGRGSVWLRGEIKAGEYSEPYLFDGYDYRQLNLSHASEQAVNFTLEVDREGKNEWVRLRVVTVPAMGAVNTVFGGEEKGAWIRLKADRDVAGVTAHFHYRNKDRRGSENNAMFDGVATAEKVAATGGLMRSLSHRTLGLAAYDRKGNPNGYYELNQSMELVAIDNQEAMSGLIEAVKPPKGVYQEDAASIVVEEDGKRYRLPRSLSVEAPFGVARVCREVATERDLLNVGGTFYELPARNAQGMAKIRPIATHHLGVHDFCSHMGLLLFTGIDADSDSEHIFRSVDGKAAVWAGVVDDLWKLGKPCGQGGPWKNTVVAAGEASDPYLMTGYDEKAVELSSSKAATIRLEVDVDGTGVWVLYKSFKLEPDVRVDYVFPKGFSAYWVRAISDRDTVGTVMFRYE